MYSSRKEGSWSATCTRSWQRILKFSERSRCRFLLNCEGRSIFRSPSSTMKSSPEPLDSLGVPPRSPPVEGYATGNGVSSEPDEVLSSGSSTTVLLAFLPTGTCQCLLLKVTLRDTRVNSSNFSLYLEVRVRCRILESNITRMTV